MNEVRKRSTKESKKEDELGNNTSSTLKMKRDVLNDLSDISRRELMKEIEKAVSNQMEKFITRTLDCETIIRQTEAGSIDFIKSPSMQNKKVDQSRGGIPEKVFIARNSVLSDLLKISHIRSLYHFFLAILIVIPLNTVLRDYIKSGTIFNRSHLDFVSWSFGKFDIVILTWLGEFATALLVFVLFQLWAKFRPKTNKVTILDWLALLVHITIQIGLLICVTKIAFDYELPPGSSFILTIEVVRLMMKIHAFVASNTKKAFTYTPCGQLESRKNSSINKSDSVHDPKLKEHLNDIDSLKRMSSGSVQPKISALVYFLFAPTLVYRDSYPRTDGINWRKVFVNLTEVAFCIFYTLFIFERFLSINKINQDYFTITNTCYLISSTSFTAGLLMLLGFFALLHSWMNMFGELLCFADRLFYTDWWNSKSYSEYYRKWNVVVHDWLYNYIYREIFLRTNSKTLASLIVFFVSALFHEYVLCVSFKFFYPVLLIQFGCFGAVLHFLKSFGNLSMWLSLMVGNAIHIVFYTMEWYARQNCLSQYEENSLYDFVMPRTWTCVMKSE